MTIMVGGFFLNMENEELLFIDEKWKDIAGYNGKYQVSNYGSVRDSKRVLFKPYPNSCGYLRVGLRKDSVLHKEFVHRLVAEAFIDNPYDLPVVNHKNENKEDNRQSNLEWMSISDNLNYGTLQERKVRSLKAARKRQSLTCFNF